MDAAKSGNVGRPAYHAATGAGSRTSGFDGDGASPNTPRRIGIPTISHARAAGAERVSADWPDIIAMRDAHDSTVDLDNADQWVASIVGNDDPRVLRLRELGQQ